MYYNKQQLEQCSPKLLELLWQQDRIENADRSSLTLEPVLAKIIRVAREENRAFVYISAMVDMLHFETCYNEVLKAIKYAEIFLREGRAIFEEALPTDTSPGAFRQNYIICYELISDVYMTFPQISTEKMEKFFELYHKNMSLYGNEILYYKCRLKWEIICRNTKAAKEVSKKMETIPLHHQCYVCTYREVNTARIMLGDIEGALAHSANIISGNVPAEARHSYITCQRATAYEQYSHLFGACLLEGRPELLVEVLPLVYKEMLTNQDSESIDVYMGLAYALYGNFTLNEAYTKEICVMLDERRLYTPYEYMYNCLIWMDYFRLLHRSGVTRTAFSTEKPISLEADSTGMYDVAEIAAYFEQMADDIGAQFEKSRDSFGYIKRKECFQTLTEMSFDGFSLD